MEENTRITMADGSSRKIKDIRMGDRVMDKDGRMCMVENIFRGAEEMLLSIRTISGRENQGKQRRVGKKGVAPELLEELDRINRELYQTYVCP